MNKLIDEARVYFTDWSVYIGHQSEIKHFALCRNQRFDSVPRCAAIPLYRWSSQFEIKELYEKYPKQMDRCAYFRFCDRIGKILAKQ